MKSIEEKGCYNYGQSPEVTCNTSTGFEFPKRSGKHHSSQHRTGLGKPTPSKWDDAQKWLVGLSRGGEKHLSVTQPRNSNADDRRLIAPVPQRENDYLDNEEVKVEENGFPSSRMQYDVETKKVDCDESVWRINKTPGNSTSAIRSICVRDMGTEMTPIASQEPSRTGTPIRATTPVAQSPISSGSSTPVRASPVGPTVAESRGANVAAGRGTSSSRLPARNWDECGTCNASDSRSSELAKPSPLENRAIAWDEAERTKYMARYKREEIKIQSWENHEKRKAEMEMKRLEVKTERLKSRALEKLANKIAATRRIAEEKRANAEAKLNEKAVKTSEKADYIRRTGLENMFKQLSKSAKAAASTRLVLQIIPRVQKGRIYGEMDMGSRTAFFTKSNDPNMKTSQAITKSLMIGYFAKVEAARQEIKSISTGPNFGERFRKLMEEETRKKKQRRRRKESSGCTMSGAQSGTSTVNTNTSGQEPREDQNGNRPVG